MIFAAITAAPTTPAPAPAPDALPEIMDIAPPLDVSPWPPWVYGCLTAIAVLAVMIVVAAIIVIIKNRPKAPPPTAREIALAALERLRERVSLVAPYEFSFAVSDVLRGYIGAQFRLRAPQQTSPEFLATIAQSVKFSEDDKTLLARFLERCDLIKFARIDASEADSSELLASAIAFVEGGRT